MVSREQNGNKAGVHSESLIKFRHTFPVDMSIPVKHTVYGFGPFRIDTGDRLLIRDGQVVSLSPMAVGALIALLDAQGHVVTKEDLARILWPNTHVEVDNALAKLVSEL